MKKRTDLPPKINFIYRKAIKSDAIPIRKISTKAPPWCLSLFLFFLSVYTLKAHSPNCIVGPNESCVNEYIEYAATGVVLHQGESIHWYVNGGAITQQAPFDTTVVVLWGAVSQGVLGYQHLNSTGEIIASCEQTIMIHPLPDNCIFNSLTLRQQACKSNSLIGCTGDTVVLSLCGDNIKVAVNWAINTGNDVLISSQEKIVTLTQLKAGKYLVCQEVIDTISGGKSESCESFEIIQKPKSQLIAIEYPEHMKEIILCKATSLTFFDISLFQDNFNQTRKWEIFDVNSSTNHPLFIGNPQNDILRYDFHTPGVFKVVLSHSTCLECHDQDELLIIVTEDRSPQILSPSVICEGETISYTTDVKCTGQLNCCQQLNWEAWADDKLIEQSTGEKFTVTWDQLPENFSGFAQVILQSSQCDPGICQQASVAVNPILPTIFEISGPTISCNKNARLSYKLPLWPGSFYTWRSIPTSGSTGTIHTNSQNNWVELDLDQFHGNFTVVVEVDHPLAGCLGTSELEVEVMDFNPVGPERVCLDDEVSYHIDPPLPDHYQASWKFGNQMHIAAGNQVSHLFDTSGIFAVELTISDSVGKEYVCGNKVLEVEVGKEVPPVQRITGPLKDLCIGESVEYEVDNPIPGTRIIWQLTGSAGTSLYFGNSIKTEWSASFANIIVYRENIATGCSSPATSFPIEFRSPAIYALEGPTVVCADGEADYQLTPKLHEPVDVVWSTVPAAAGTIISQSKTAVQVQWHTDGATTFQVMLKAEITHCDGSTTTSSRIIEITPLPVLTVAQSYGQVCINDDVELLAAAWYPGSSSHLNGSYHWTLYRNDRIIMQVDKQQFMHSFSPGEHGIYRVFLKFISSDERCPNTLTTTFDLEVIDFPEPFISTPFNVCNEEEQTPLLFTQDYAHLGGAAYQWAYQKKGDPGLTIIPLSNRPYQEIIYSEEGVTYFVTVGLAGCEKTARITIDCNQPPDVCECENVAPDIRSIKYNEQCGNVMLYGTLPRNGIHGSWHIEDPTFENGDGRIVPYGLGANQYISHDFSTPGFYRVTMISKCPTDNTCQFIDQDRVQIPLVTDFNYNLNFDTSAPKTYTFSFSDASSLLPNGFDDEGQFTETEVLSRKWTITGPTTKTSSESSFTTALQAGATYLVNLAMETNLGYSCEKEYSIQVPTIPVLRIEQVQGCTDEPITFSPDEGLSDEEVAAYEWHVNIDGTDYYSYNRYPTFSFSIGGIKKIALTVKTTLGAIIHDEVEIKILPALLGHIATVYDSCNTSAMLSFQPSFADSSLLNYRWSTGAITQQIMPVSSGIYTVSVSEPNNFCPLRTYQRRVTLRDTVSLRGPDRICEGGRLDIRARRNDIPPGFTLQWRTNVQPPIHNLAPVNQQDFRFIGTAPADINKIIVTATLVNDNGSCTDQISNHIVTINAQPVLNLVSEVISCNPLEVQLKEASGLNVRWWDIDNNVLGSNQIVVNKPGVYVAKYTENTCQLTKELRIDQPIDFSPFIFGQYELCIDQLDGSQCVPGIPGEFSEWSWVNPHDPATPYLSGSFSSIQPLCIDDQMKGPIALKVVTHHGCRGMSAPFYIDFTSCNSTCEILPRDIKKLSCAGVNPINGHDLYYVHWSTESASKPGFGIPCADLSPTDIEVKRGSFISLNTGSDSKELEAWYHFEGIIDLDPGVAIEDLILEVPYCDRTTGFSCGQDVLRLTEPMNTQVIYCPDATCDMSTQLQGVVVHHELENDSIQELKISYKVNNLIVGNEYTLRVFSSTGQIIGNLGNAQEFTRITATNHSFEDSLSIFWVPSGETRIACLNFVFSNESAPWGPFCNRIFCFDLDQTTTYKLTRATKAPPSAISSLFPSGSVLDAFPNPANDQLAINYDLGPTDQKYTLIFIDLLGQKIKEIDLSTKKGVVSLPTIDFNPGVYQCILMSNQQMIKVIKIIIQH